MLFGPIVWRELRLQSRRRGTFTGRCTSAAFLLVAIAVMAWIWAFYEQEMTSIGGIATYTLSMFGILLGFLFMATIGVVPSEVGAIIARERERKTLDNLLATRLSDAQLVLGALGAGLIRYLTGFAVWFSVVVWMVPLWGLDPRLLVLGSLGMLTTALFIAVLSIIASIHGRDARRATSFAALFVMLWLFVPFIVVFAMPRLWPFGAYYVRPLAVFLLDSSPIAIFLNVAGVSRRGTVWDAFWRMVGMEMGGALLLLAWAIWRVRAASRAAYDAESRVLLRRLALGPGRWLRPPCGDDPILWYERYSTRGTKAWQRALHRVIQVGLLITFVVGLYWFAQPAYAELLRDGFGAEPKGIASLELNPFVRVLVIGLRTLPEPGMARVELNYLMRYCAAFSHALIVMCAASFVVESIMGERDKDTWTALIATPLSGRDILRGKMWGAVWRMWEALSVMAVLYVVTLGAGALHPIGFILAVLNLVGSCWLMLAIGAYVAIWAKNRAEAMNRIVFIGMFLSMSIILVIMFAIRTHVARAWMGAGCIPFVTWLSLVSFEDVRDTMQTGVFPLLTYVRFDTGEGWRAVSGTIVFAVTAQWIAAFLLDRAAIRQFDAAIGRPMRPRSDVGPQVALDGESERLGALAADEHAGTVAEFEADAPVAARS